MSKIKAEIITTLDDGGVRTRITGDARTEDLAQAFGHMGVTIWGAVVDLYLAREDEPPTLGGFYDFAKAWAHWYLERKSPEDETSIEEVGATP